MSSSKGPYVVNYSEDEVKKAHEILFNEGLRMRIKVAGADYVEKSINANKDPFSRPMQELVTEFCWGSAWTRPGLPLNTRSFLNIAMLCNQNRGTELATHVRGALNNGATEEEIAEVILQAAVYCGVPSGIEGFRVAKQAVMSWKEEQSRKGHGTDEHEDVGVADRMNLENI